MDLVEGQTMLGHGYLSTSTPRGWAESPEGRATTQWAVVPKATLVIGHHELTVVPEVGR